MTRRPRLSRGSAHVQCELYRRLRNFGWDIVPEYGFPEHRMVADLAVIMDDTPVLLIEAKDRKKPRVAFNETKQWRKYKATGVPFVYCDGMKQVNGVVREVNQALRRIESEAIYKARADKALALALDLPPSES